MREDSGGGWAVLEGSLRLGVAVQNAMLAEALSAAATRAGWRPVPARDGTCDGAVDAVLLTDRAPVRSTSVPIAARVVLVCAPTPYSARCALDSISDLSAAAVVCADAPGDVGCALDGLARGQASVPLRVLDLAARMPTLSDRQVEILAALASGRSNTEIGRLLFISAASVKRELAVLYCTLDASTRPMLAARGLELGVGPTTWP